MRILLLISTGLLFFQGIQISADDHWNQFRGPNANGHTQADSLPLKWSESSHLTWKTDIPGKAWSSPVVWDNQIWMTNATKDGKELDVLCLDANSGKIFKTINVFKIEKPQFCYPFNSYASPTPVIEDGKIWVHYGSAGTACINTSTGKLIWQRQDLPCDHFRGPGSSPIIFKNLLMINFDGVDQQYVVALDKLTGKTVWKSDRDIDYKTDDGDFKKAYSTPLVINHQGRLQLISPASVATIAYNPFTGEELWIVYHGGFNAAARPLYSHGMVIISLESGLRLLAVKPDGEGDVTESHIVWSYKKATPRRSSQLIVDDTLYMVNDKGIVSSLDVMTGEMNWTHRIGGDFSASPIYGKSGIFLFDEKGKSYVVEANPKKFKLISNNKLDSGCMASPAVIGNSLIVRTKKSLYRIDQ